MTAPAHYRRNFVALMGDYVGFATAMTFASQTTVLPDLVSRLTDSELAVGLLSSVISGAWLLPWRSPPHRTSSTTPRSSGNASCSTRKAYPRNTPKIAKSRQELNVVALTSGALNPFRVFSRV